jgi:hypothetical protein
MPRQFFFLLAISLAAENSFGAQGGGGLGVDVALPGLDAGAFRCMKEKAGLDWTVFRAFHSFGAFDNSSLVNLELSQKAGIKTTDVYMFPCRGKDARAQVKELMAGLANAVFTTVWLDVEENPSTGCSWKPSDGEDPGTVAKGNCQFLETLISALTRTGTVVGVYSSHYEWNQTVGLSCTAASSMPLWYSHYDKKSDCTDFEQLPFGGWTRAFAKQFDDNVGGNPALNECIGEKVPADIDVLC